MTTAQAQSQDLDVTMTDAELRKLIHKLVEEATEVPVPLVNIYLGVARVFADREFLRLENEAHQARRFAEQSPQDRTQAAIYRNASRKFIDHVMTYASMVDPQIKIMVLGGTLYNRNVPDSELAGVIRAF